MENKNIYIENADKIKEITIEERGADGVTRQKPATVDVQLDVFDNEHKLPYNAKARAEYKQYIGVQLSSPDMDALRG